MKDPRYPIGKAAIDLADIKANKAAYLANFRTFPQKLSALVLPLTDEQLELPYRDGGWTIRQVVHHLSDSHANMYIRVKSALAKDGNPIMGYDEGTWATFPDNELPLSVSLKMLDAIHEKLAYLLTNSNDETLNHRYFHSGDGQFYQLWEVIGLYDWHSRHHYAHVEQALATQ